MHETILVVDDDREIVGAIAILLEKEGYRVIRAYNGMEALDRVMDPAVQPAARRRTRSWASR